MRTVTLPVPPISESGTQPASSVHGVVDAGRSHPPSHGRYHLDMSPAFPVSAFLSPLGVTPALGSVRVN